MTTVKHGQLKHSNSQVNNDGREQPNDGEQSSSQVERVTAETYKAKYLKKVKAGRASAAARKVQQERLLKDLQVAKESLKMSPATNSTEPDQSEGLNRASKKHVTQKEESWIPWILGASSLAVVFLFHHFTALQHQKGAQQKKQAVSKTPDVVMKQLNIDDSFYME